MLLYPDKILIMRTWSILGLGLTVAFASVMTATAKQEPQTSYGDLLRGQTKNSKGPSLPSSCHGTPNNIPIHTQEPVLLNRTAYGSRWEVGPADMEPKISMIHVYGSAYNMGYGYGSLMRYEVSLKGVFVLLSVPPLKYSSKL